jgi:recombination protein RecR
MVVFFMDPLTTLTELLRDLPGIGPRQARRSAFVLAQKNPHWRKKFITALIDAEKKVHFCKECMHLFTRKRDDETLCPICRDIHRDDDTLLIVEKDADLENIEKTGVFQGKYFVLGGTTSPRSKKPEKEIHLSLLEKRIEEKKNLKEIIFALSANTEGDDTVRFLRTYLEEKCTALEIKMSILGRGISTGTELEYIDTDTMIYALKGRG